MYKILLVEDDTIIADSLIQLIEGWGYTGEKVTDFQAVKEHFVRFSPHLVLMDLALPGRNGFYWCEEIRKLSKVPIIFISSAKDNMNMVTAMNLGADDFIAKPFDIHVLVAKIQALLRRTYDFSSGNNLLEHEGVFLNLNDLMVSYKEDKVELSKNEFKILQILMENPGRVITREVIMQRLWESDSFIDDNTLTVNVARLRKKLEQIGIKNYIETKKNLGYRIP